MNVEKLEPVNDLIRRIRVYLERDDLQLNPDTSMQTELPGVDSLRLKELLLFLEDEYKIEFTPDILGKMQTLRDLSNAIEAARAR